MAQLLRTKRQLLLDTWEERVRALPGEPDVTRPQLINHIPDLLDRIAQGLESCTPGRRLDLDGVPETHALERLDQGYDLGVLTAEYAVLRTCVLELYFRESAGALNADDVLRFDQAIDTAIIESVERYARARARTLIALDRVSEAALDSEDLASFFPKLLRVVLETTESVDSAVILLREGDRLSPHAAVGLLEEREAGFSLAIGEGFAGTIAATGKPLALQSAATDPLVKSPFIRTRGVRALYGVPLFSAGEVIGVAHMGSRTTEEFSEDDKLLFRTMVSRASAVIAQAKLRAELDQGAAELKAIIESIPEGIFVGDASGEARCNTAAARMLGCERPEEGCRSLAGLDVRDAETGERLTVEDLSIRRAPESDTSVRELRAWHRERGEWRHLRRSASPVRQAGRVTGAVAVFTDITAEKRAEAERVALLEREKRAREQAEESLALVDAFFTTAPIGMAFLDTDLRFMRVNPIVAEANGLPAEAHLGRTLRDVLPEVADLLEPILRQVLERREPVLNLENTVQLLGWDEVRTYRGSYFPAVDAEGVVRGVGATLVDVTEAKRTATALERQRELYEALLHAQSDMGIGITVIEGTRAVFVNEGLCRMLGYPAEELLRPGAYERVLAPENREAFLVRQRGVESSRPSHYEVLAVHKDGHTLTLEVETVWLGEGRRVTVSRDVTERRAEQAERERLMQQLTRELGFRERVMGILGHDLRSPLAAIRATTALLFRRGQLPEVAMRNLQRIDRSASRMAEMIAALLDFTHSRFKGTIPISLEQTELGSVVREEVAELELANPERSIRLRIHGDTSGQWDAGRLSQVVRNLVTNALRYGEAERPVYVDVKDSGADVVLEVCNHGPPIPAEAVPALFEPFRQGAAAAPARENAGEKGLGLGLYIVQQVARAHGGSVDVVSEPAEGIVRFSVRLPRGRA